MPVGDLWQLSVPSGGLMGLRHTSAVSRFRSFLWKLELYCRRHLAPLREAAPRLLQTSSWLPYREEENRSWDHFGCLWGDGEAQDVLIDLCGPLISLTASWFIETGLEVQQGYGSKHPGSPRAQRPAQNWGQLTARQLPQCCTPAAASSLTVFFFFEGWACKASKTTSIRDE